MDEWSRGEPTKRRKQSTTRSFSHPCTSPSMCLIFIPTPDWVSPTSPSTSQTLILPPPPPHNTHPPSLLAPAPSPWICVDVACRSEAKGQWSRMKDLLSALHAHRRWLHALRCDTESQMLCRTHYVTHTHTCRPHRSVRMHLIRACTGAEDAHM